MLPCVQFMVFPLESRKVIIRIAYGLLESRKLAISIYLSVGVNKISTQPQTPRFGPSSRLAHDSITRRCRRIHWRRTCQRSISWASTHCALEKSHPVIFIVNVYGIGLVGIFWWILPSQRCNFVAIFDVGNNQYLCNWRDLPLKLVAVLCQYLRWWSWEGTVFDAEWTLCRCNRSRHCLSLTLLLHVLYQNYFM
jgi:hypothetical protein